MKVLLEEEEAMGGHGERYEGSRRNGLGAISSEMGKESIRQQDARRISGGSMRGRLDFRERPPGAVEDCGLDVARVIFSGEGAIRRSGATLDPGSAAFGQTGM